MSSLSEYEYQWMSRSNKSVSQIMNRMRRRVTILNILIKNGELPTRYEKTYSTGNKFKDYMSFINK